MDDIYNKWRKGYCVSVDGKDINIKYLKDTPETREILSKEFGEFEYIDLMKDYTYIIFYEDTKKWKPTFAFEWLYREIPELTPLDEILKKSKKDMKNHLLLKRLFSYFKNKKQYFKNKNKYRIVQDRFAGYEVQIKRWWVPFYWSMYQYSNTFSSIKNAKKWLSDCGHDLNKIKIEIKL